MKKIIISFLAIVMCFTLAGCNDEKTNDDKSGNNSNQEEKSNNEQEKNDKSETAILSKAGLNLEDIKPDEKYYRVNYDSSEYEFVFYMEKGTEKNVGEYVHKIVEACKNASTDGKIYKADFNFFMNNGTATELEMPSKEKINEDGKYNYIAQFGYLYNGNTIAITIGSVSDMDGERNDDVYYPTYSFDINF